MFSVMLGINLLLMASIMLILCVSYQAVLLVDIVKYVNCIVITCCNAYTTFFGYTDIDTAGLSLQCLKFVI